MLVVMGPGVPGCVKSPSFNLCVEHLSQFHRYGNQLHWQPRSGRRQLRKQFCASLAHATFHTAWNARTPSVGALALIAPPCRFLFERLSVIFLYLFSDAGGY